MKRFGLIAALILLLTINGIVLGGVYYNRSGAPEASLVLTERELPLMAGYRQRENSGVSLLLNWNRYNSNLDWFDEVKVLELGFDKRELASGEGSYRYYRTLPIKAFVVLEYDGAAWQDYREQLEEELAALPDKVAKEGMEQEAAERRTKEIEKNIQLASRLFAVDAGNNPETLRSRYPQRDKYFILPAKVRASVQWEKTPDQSEQIHVLKGHIDQVLTQTLYVPIQYHDLLGEVPSNERLRSGNYYYGDANKQRAHYQVTLNVGQRYEPWVEGIEKIVE